MSQHIDPTPKQTSLDALSDSIGSLFKRVTYQVPFSWYSTANPFVDIQKNVAISGYTPVAFDWIINGTGATSIITYNHYISGNTIVLGVRMNGTPATVDQNSATITVLYIKNGSLS